MLSAEKHLMNSALAATKEITSSPSTEQGRKRRHTATAWSHPSKHSPEKRVKRVRTTYSKSRTIADEDEGEVRSSRPRTSQPAHFSGHTDVGDPRSSAEIGLPGGSIGVDFANHEPAVLFRESGSTVEDSSSAQKRYWEQARMSKTRLSSSNVRADVPATIHGELKSSSLAWWSASEETTGGNDQNENCPGAAQEGHIMDHDRQEDSAAASAKSHRTTQKDPPIRHSQPEHHPTLEVSVLSNDIAPKLHASPIVEIPLLDNTSARSKEAGSVQKPSQGRMRRSEANDIGSGSLNSDDKAVGLPKELYVPRPSRRRATGIVEEAIDFSLVPEKAARAKRTKTTSTAATGRALKLGKADGASDVDELLPSHKTGDDGTIDAKSPPLKKTEERMAHQAVEDNLQLHGTKHATNLKAISQDVSPSNVVEPQEEIEAFTKPTLSLPKAKSSRTRRSHTTIFEDHIEFVGTQRSSPSLSQQQAKRKSAIRSSGEGIPNTTQRARRSIILDEEDLDDDVDGLVKETKDGSPPPKRGRGRPPKSISTAKSKSKKIEKENSEDEDDDNNLADKEAGTKSKRGLLLDVTTAATSTSAASDKENHPLATDRNTEEARPSKTIDDTNYFEHIVKTPPKSKPASTQEIPTPSPEKLQEEHLEKAESTPQTISKPDPNSHSPIKSSSSVPLRVGLSRKYRIPSLLRTMRPPKQ